MKMNGIDEYMRDGPTPVTVEPCEYCRATGCEMERIESRWWWQRKPRGWRSVTCSNCHGYRMADWRFQFPQPHNRRPPTGSELAWLAAILKTRQSGMGAADALGALLSPKQEGARVQ